MRILGHGGGDHRDKELFREGVGVLPAVVHSGEHPVPNHCWSPLSLLPLAQLAKAAPLMGAGHWQEWVRWPRFPLLRPFKGRHRLTEVTKGLCPI